MKEKNLAILIIIILICLGIIGGIISLAVINSMNNDSYNEFNFYKSQLDINGTHIKETLYFNTDKPYHTLFRTFQSPVGTINDKSIRNSVLIDSVECEKGNPYFRTKDKCYMLADFKNPVSCPAYTENNEYGCTFGNFYGFQEAEEYKIISTFELNPENLFKINGKNYIKFIAYGRNNHKPLNLNENLIINGNTITTENYPSKDYVIVYIPYEEDLKGINVIEKSGFEYDSIPKEEQNPLITMLINIGIMLIHLIPAILFFCSWYFFGKELSEEDVPEQLSDIPNKRKPWEVAIFFNPPFSEMDRNFFSTMLLDFYRRKIIDLKLSKKLFGNDLLVRINKQDPSALDKIESKFLKMLSDLENLCPEKYKDKGYFNLNRVTGSYSGQTALRSIIMEFKEDLKEESKKYLEKKGLIFFIISMLITGFISNILFFLIGLFALSLFSLIFIMMLSVKSSLLTKHKSDFYAEYQKWQSFKKWLKGSPSMKETGHKGVVLWEEYLVYATALGVSKQVLKELKNEGLVNEKDYNFYSGINLASTSFAVSSGGSSGGGFGGAGGGGVGGGGGGGR